CRHGTLGAASQAEGARRRLTAQIRRCVGRGTAWPTSLVHAYAWEYSSLFEILGGNASTFGTPEARTGLPNICACRLIVPPRLRRGISRGWRHPANGSKRGLRPVQ